MSLCLVTAFLDISRGEWKSFQRTTRQYINNFLHYKKLGHELIVFIDDKHIDILRELCVNWENLTIIPINREWMKENIHAYRLLDKEKEIMDSPKFKESVKHRIHHPECCKPEYNIIQHSKIDFVCFAIKQNLSKADHYAWTDFGHFQHSSLVPESGLDLNKFDLTKINYTGPSPLTKDDFNITYTLTQAPERIGGAFYLASKEKMFEYQELYHKVHQHFHDLGIVDDDQHIAIQCYFREPSKFKLFVVGGMLHTYLFFQKNAAILECGTNVVKVEHLSIELLESQFLSGKVFGSWKEYLMLSEHFRNKNDPKSSYICAKKALTLNPTKDVISKIYYELSIACYYTKLMEEGFDVCEKILFSNDSNTDMRKSTMFNEKFYMKPLQMKKRLEIKNGVEMGDRMLKFSNPYTMTPCIIKTKTGYRICVRTEKWRHPDYTYSFANPDTTINYIVDTDKDLKLLNCVELVDKSGVKLFSGRTLGIQDIRLISENEFFATYPELNKDAIGQVCHGKFTEDGSITNIVELNVTGKIQWEKNWLPFVVEEDLHFIYKWGPFQIYKLVENKPILVKNLIGFPSIDLRGSGSPICYKNGWLCTVHTVHYSNCRTYFHRFVWMNSDYSVMKISKPFYFEKIGVEFSLSICDSGEDILIGYSVNDESTIISSVSYETIHSMLEYSF